jgi:hypothetical protein
MTSLEDQRRTRHLLREIVLAVMGTFSLYEVEPAVGTALARMLTQIADAHDAGIGRPRYARGRAALRALRNELERPDRQLQSKHERSTEATR